MLRNALLNPSRGQGFILPAVFVMLAIVVTLFFATQVQAADGIQKTINFQGKVTNTDGTNVADGAYDFVIRIYDGAGNGATALFTETWSNASLFSSTMSTAPTTSSDTLVYSSSTNEGTLRVGQILWNTTKKESVIITSVDTGTNTLGISRPLVNWANSDTITNRIYVKDGVFRVSINSLNANLSGVNFNSDSLFVGVNFNADGEMKPRMQLRSNAYAFNAERVNGLIVTNTSDNPFASTTTLKIGDGKTVVINNGLTFSGTDSTTFTFPSGSGTVVTLDATQSLTNKTIGSTGLTFSGAALDITTGSDETLTLTPNGIGNVLINPSAGGQAALIINKQGDNDIFTASASGTTRFVIGNNGNLKLDQSQYASCRLTTDSSGNVICSGDNTGSSRFIVKGSDQNIASGTTLTDDTALTFSVGANETWTVSYFLRVTNLNNATPDWKAAVKGASGWSCSMTQSGEEPAGAAFPQATTTDCDDVPGSLINNTIAADVNVPFQVRIQGTVTTNSTGAITLQWAPNVSGSLTVLSGSYVQAQKVGGTDGVGTMTIRETDASISVGNVTTLEFGPGSTSEDEFIVTDETAGISRVRVGNMIGMLNQAETVTGGWTFNTGATTFTTAINANGGISLDNASDTISAFTAAGTINMNTNILENIGNTGTDFIATTGALNLAGVLTANGGVTVSNGQTLDANGQADIGDGGDSITLNGSSLMLQTTGAGSDITIDAVDQVILTDFANCTALETASGVLTCGTDDGGAVLWSQLGNPSGNLALTMSTNTTAFNWATGTGTNNLYSLTTDNSADGTGALLNLQTGTSATVLPLRVRAGSTEALTVKADGNIGIGTTNPGVKLDVTGDFRTSAAVTFSNLITDANAVLYTTTGGVLTRVAETETGSLCLLSGAGASGVPVWGSCGGSSSAWSSINNPSTNLSLSMSTNTTTFNWATGTGTNNLFSLTTDASANGTGALFNLQTGTSSTVLPLRIRAGSTEALTVKADGNVGIGTTDPGAKLAVVGQGSGDIKMGSAGLGGNYSAISLNGTLSSTAWNFTSSTSDTNLYINRPSGSNISFHENNGGSQMTISTGGNIGMGVGNYNFGRLSVRTDGASTNSYNNVLSLWGGTTGGTAQNGLGASMQFLVENDDAAGTIYTKVGSITGVITDVTNASVDGALVFATTLNGTTDVEKMRLDNNGNLGIGTTAPTDKLHVSGNVQIGAQADATGSISLTNSAAGTFNGTANLDAVTSSVVYKGKLFVSTRETDSGGVYRYDGGTTWTLVTNAVGKAVSGDATTTDSFVLTVYNGALYIGSQGTTNTAGLYSSTTAHTTADSFTLVNATRGSFGMSQTAIDGVSDLTVWKGNLIVSTQEANAWELGRYDGGTTFTQINTPDGEFVSTDATDIDGAVLAVFQGRLFIGAVTGSTTARVGVHDGVGTTLTGLNATQGTFGAETTNVDVTSMVVYNGELYVSVSKASAGGIYRWLPTANSSSTTVTNWNLSNLGAGEMNSGDTANLIESMTLRVYNGRLYAGTTTGADGTAAVYEYDGVKGSWTLINGTRGTFGSQAGVNNVSSLIPMDGVLYIGTDESNVGSVYSFTKTAQNSYSLKFDSGNSNFGAISFTGNKQAGDGTGRYGVFNFSNTVSLATGAFDYAEDYPTTDQSLSAGEIVAIDDQNSEYVKRAPKGSSLIGIVSENPGFRLQQSADKLNGARWIPIALVGRVPVKVTTENGPIKKGDSLTISSIDGVAMRATKAGAVIGQAMEDYTAEGVGSIVVYVNTGSFNGVKTESGLDIATGSTLASWAQSESPLQSRKILAQLVTAKHSLEDGVNLSEIVTDRVIAGLEVITPRIVADEVVARVIRADRIEGLEIIESGVRNQESRLALLEGLVASGSAKPVVLGVSTTGTVTVPTATPAQVAGQSGDTIEKLSDLLARTDVGSHAENDRFITVSGLSVDREATVSGTLRVKGNAMIEGVLNIIDTLTAHNLVINGLAHFFGDVVFSGKVFFETAPTFHQDTAGYVTVSKGQKTVSVRFEEAYEEEPVITATIVAKNLNDDDFKKLIDAEYCSESDGKDMCQEKLALELLREKPEYIITNRSEKGFTILLPSEAAIDYTFSWTALSVKKVTRRNEESDVKAEKWMEEFFGG